MNSLILYMILLPAITIGSCALWSVLVKKTGLKNADSRPGNIITGLFFGAAAVVAAIMNDLTGNAYPDTLIIGSCGLIPVCAGLFFSGSAGMISAVIGTLYEILSFIIQGIEYAQISDALATILSGLSALLVSKYLLRDRRPSAVLCIISALEVAALNIVIYPITSLSISANLGRMSGIVILSMLFINTIGLVGSLMAVRKIATGSFRQEKADSHGGRKTAGLSAMIGIAVFIITSAVFFACITAVSRRSKVSEITAELDAAEAYINNNPDSLRKNDDSFMVYNPGNLIVINSEGKVTSNSGSEVNLSEETDIEITSDNSEDELYRVNIDGKNYLMMFRRVCDHIIVDLADENSIYEFRWPFVFLIISIEILIVYILIISIDILVEKELILREEEINESLTRIMGRDSGKVICDEYSITGSGITVHLENIAARISGEMKFAGDIQMQSLPIGSLQTDGVSIRASVKPARMVGGDFYDYFRIDGNRIAFLIADVSGKGISAAMFMMRAKAAIRGVFSSENVDVIGKANDILSEGNADEMFVTAWIGVIDPLTGTVQYVNAAMGNNIYRDVNDEYRLTEDDPEAPLGIRKGKKYQVHRLQMKPGSRLFLYTDGVTDAENTDAEMYGEESILRFLNQNCLTSNAAETIDCFAGELSTYAGDAEQFDDITMMTVDYFGQWEDFNYTSRVFAADDGNLDAATEFINLSLKPLGCSEVQLMEIDVAFEELFVNISHYAYKESSGDVGIEVSTDFGMAAIRITDSGRMFNPLRQREPDNSVPLHERKEGGLGITMVKACVNYADYKYEDGKNIFTMIKVIR